jgi:F-box-like
MWRKRIPRRVSFVDILPNELLVQIFNSCGAQDIGRLAKVCTRLHEVVQDSIISLHQIRITAFGTEQIITFDSSSNMG